MRPYITIWTGDLLCTTHAASVGIYLWANRTHFANVFLAHTAPTDATDLKLPTSSGPQEPDAGKLLVYEALSC